MKSVLVIFLAIGATLSANASVINIPADQPTIQAGIDAAAVGDTVLVAAGSYTGAGNRDLEFHGKNIVVMSSGGLVLTTIDCEGTAVDPHAAFNLHEREDSSSVIDGFTITGAYAKGAIACSTSVVTVRNCLIQNNHANGVYCYPSYSSPGNSPLQVLGCEILNNTGNGIWSRDRSARIQNCEIGANDSAGVFYYAGNQRATFSHLLIRDNKQNGFVLAINMVGSAKIENATIVRNDFGLLFYMDFPKTGSPAERPVSDSMVIRNCIVAFNNKGGIVALPEPNGTLGACNDAYGNGQYDFAGALSFHAGDTLGNISIDPLFCDRLASDYHLSKESSCAPANNSCQMLMGVYDVTCVCCKLTTGNVDGDPADQVDISDLQALIDNLFFSMPITPCAAEADLDGSGSLDISDLQALIDHLFFGTPLPLCK